MMPASSWSARIRLLVRGGLGHQVHRPGLAEERLGVGQVRRGDRLERDTLHDAPVRDPGLRIVARIARSLARSRMAPWFFVLYMYGMLGWILYATTTRTVRQHRAVF